MRKLIFADSSESGSNKGRDSGSCRSGGGNNKVSSDGKPTRVRTVLNEKQLHTLRTCYAANPRPDALMKEQLVEMTGLSPRVIRVWFQNKRCKDKKRAILMKQQLQQEKDGRKLGYGGMQGIPMVASSPVRHESPLGLNPIEVHSYQPPWKALSDFALHTDLDRLDPAAPPFQHLVNQMHGYDIHGPPSHHDLGPPPNDVGHPDSTDSYVTYLESDDDHDGSSP
ncbi:Insulin protein enhancer protein isl-1 [Polyplax serrata]|uniref:Insulin protein enhancer protein isl-1 n=1 Tax=Polyplax serrata TaxID=468196 RepID=A0ABR1API8_POLSC